MPSKKKPKKELKAWFLQIRRVKDDSVYLERGQFTLRQANILDEQISEKLDSSYHYTYLVEKTIGDKRVKSRCCEQYSWPSPIANICSWICNDWQTERCKYHD
jgi:hypothetical protein